MKEQNAGNVKKPPMVKRVEATQALSSSNSARDGRGEIPYWKKSDLNFFLMNAPQHYGYEDC